MTMSKKTSALPVATSISNSDSLVMVNATGQCFLVKVETIKDYIGAPTLHSFSIPAGQKMVFKLTIFGFHAFTLSGSGGTLQASGFITGYNNGTERWLLNGKQKGSSSNRYIKVYVSNTSSGIGYFVVENLYTAALNVNFVSSARTMAAEVYNEAIHGDLAELSWN